jgi:hypothetical protein
MAKHFEDVSKLSTKIGALSNSAGASAAGDSGGGLVSPKAKKVRRVQFACVCGVVVGQRWMGVGVVAGPRAHP